MKRRTLLTGTTALVGLTALPWRRLAAQKGEAGTPKPGGTLRVAFASDIHAGRFQLNRMAPPGYETFWVSTTRITPWYVGPGVQDRAGPGEILGDH